jgi:DNA replication protein DnaC
MMNVIGRRYNDKKLTIFTTNYPDARGGASDETLEDRVGVRLHSHLYEMCRGVTLEGDDYRRRFDADHATDAVVKFGS